MDKETIAKVMESVRDDLKANGYVGMDFNSLLDPYGNPLLELKSNDLRKIERSE